MSFIRTILPLLRAFQLFGLSPFSIDANLSELTVRNRWTIWMVVIVIVNIALFFYDIMASYSNYGTGIALRDIIDVASLITIRLGALVCVTEAFLNRSQQIDILNKLAMIDATLSNELEASSRDDSESRQTLGYFRKWVSAILLNEITVAIIIIIDSNPVYLEPWLSSCVSWYLTTVGYIQTTLYVRSVLVRFKVLNKRNELLRLEVGRPDTSCSMINQSMETETIEQLSVIRKLYQNLWEVSHSINECFKWSLLVNIGNDFFRLAANLYWLFTWLANPVAADALGISPNLFWGISNVIHIVLIAHNCHFTVLEVSNGLCKRLDCRHKTSTIRPIRLHLVLIPMPTTQNGLTGTIWLENFSCRRCIRRCPSLPMDCSTSTTLWCFRCGLLAWKIPWFHVIFFS